MYMYRMMYNVLVMLMHPVPPVCISATHRCGAVVAVDLEVEQLWKEVLLFTAGLLPAKPGGGTQASMHIYFVYIVIPVEPPNKGHLGTRASVLYSEVSFIRRLEMC